MAKLRVHELAKQLDISSKDAIDHLTRLGVEVKSHASSIEDYLIQHVERSMRGEAPPPREEADPRRRVSRRGHRQSGRLRSDDAGDRPSITKVVAAPPPAPIVRRVMVVEEPPAPTPAVELIAEEAVEPVASEPTLTESVVADLGPVAVTAEPPAPPKPVDESPPAIASEPEVVEAVEPEYQPRAAVKTPEQMATEEARIEALVQDRQPKPRSAEAPTTPTSQPSAGRREERGRKRKGADRQQQREPRPEPVRPQPAVKAPMVGETVEITDPIALRDLAKAFGLDTSDILRELMMRGAPSTINTSVGGKLATAIANDLGIHVTVVEGAVEPKRERERPIDDAKKRERRKKKTKIIVREPAGMVSVPPVVTVMGHVDHGKTSLLDYIRSTKVAERESGGITQHIGASEIRHNGKRIVFIDTPGHEAFTAMRARGAQVTDIAILVVAADDGVMPQTIEAIHHARAAKVPIIVAVNKMDLPGANPDRVLQQLTEFEIVPEAWGGDTVTVNVSALEGTGIDALLEYILLIAEVEDLKAPVGIPARAVVIEGENDVSRGAVVTVIVREGTLRVGDSVVCGQAWGRVRAMVRPSGKRVKEAGPGTAVEIMGLSEVPGASEELVAVDNPREARAIAEEAADDAQSAAHGPMAQGVTTLEDLYSQVESGAVKDLNLIVKADVQGTLEALTQSIGRLHHDEIKINVVLGGIGNINESDILLASSTNAIVIAFRVGEESGAEEAAKNERVEIRSYEVIYHLIDDIKLAMQGLLEPHYKERELGRAEVRVLFKISRFGVIAGCMVTDGTLRRGEKIRILRGKDVVYEGNLDSLKHVKDDVREMAHGRECGISLGAFNRFEEGDIITCYTIDTIVRTL